MRDREAIGAGLVEGTRNPPSAGSLLAPPALRRLRNALLLALAPLVAPSFAALDVHDTLIAGTPWTAISSQPSKDAKKSRSERPALSIDKDRSVPRARLTLPDGAAWTFWDRSPFARQGRGVVSIALPARVRGATLVVPRDCPVVAKLAARAASARPTTAPAAPALAAPPRAAAPIASPAAESATSTPSAPRTTDSSPEVPAASSTDSVSKAPPAPSAPEPEPAPATASRAPSRSDVADLVGDDGVFTVVLDAGHGGKDPGAVGKKVDGKPLQEKDATLGIIEKIRDELKGYKGVRVVLTRDEDVFLSLGERTRKANAAKGDLFVSVHCNSLPMNSPRRDEVQGFMVYLLREAKSAADKAIERRENEAIRFETGERQRKEALSPLEWVMLEHQLNLYTKESERFAGLVVRNLESQAHVHKERTGAGQAGFFVLVGALMPSVLIETGYVSHDKDAETLASESGRKAIARQIARAIDEFRRARH